MNELDYIRAHLGRSDFYLGALLDRLEAERERFAGEARRLSEENRRLLAENERFREEIAVTRLARQRELPACPTEGGDLTPGEGSESEREAARFYRRLPAAFTFGEFIQAAEAVGFGQRRAKRVLLALLREGTLRLNGARVEKAGRPAPPGAAAG